jgi:capsular polysaccharide biosynthesis protein
LLAETVAVRTLPVNLRAEDRRLFEGELSRVIPPTSVITRTNVSVTPDGILFRRAWPLPEGYPNPEHLKGTWVRSMPFRFFLRQYVLNRRQPWAKPAFWITDIWSHTYFHWLTDALTRLYIIREQVRGGTLLLPGAFAKSAYVRESLRPFGLGEIHYVDRTLRCRRLDIPLHTAPTGHYNEPVVQGLREWYDQHPPGTPAPATGERVYVSRSRASVRRILNEAECEAVLESFGFRKVHFEDYSFDEQVQIAQQTKYLVANHGAGMTNMIFMPKGGAVLELRKRDDDHNNCFFSLSSAMGLAYYYQTCEGSRSDPNAYGAHLRVDVDELRRNLEAMLASTGRATTASV